MIGIQNCQNLTMNYVVSSDIKCENSCNFLNSNKCDYSLISFSNILDGMSLDSEAFTFSFIFNYLNYIDNNLTNCHHNGINLNSIQNLKFRMAVFSKCNGCCFHFSGQISNDIQIENAI